ncbi:hypothetical protein K440DRAFT_258993 [Wilcoxina mikolae CBS 423.85]|nr:hypothetical protein K440DRAFT_258993 [Wilcoxina mikolae CBS 423.85]
MGQFVWAPSYGVSLESVCLLFGCLSVLSDISMSHHHRHHLPFLDFYYILGHLFFSGSSGGWVLCLTSETMGGLLFFVFFAC